MPLLNSDKLDLELFMRQGYGYLGQVWTLRVNGVVGGEGWAFTAPFDTTHVEKPVKISRKDGIPD